MTLIIGVKSRDGIVLGADGAVTFTALGHQTARQTSKKLEILKGTIVFGVSGSVGVAQRMRGEIEELWMNNKFAGKKTHEAMTILRAGLWKYVEPEFRAADVAQRVVGGVATQSAICSTLVALPVSKALCLYSFDQQCSPYEVNDMPFVSIGSGQPIADPFLAFIRRIFWTDGLPTLQQGVFGTLWTLRHAIQTSPGGIGDPVQLVTLTESQTGFAARELAEAELQEHEEAIKSIEQQLAQFLSEGPKAAAAPAEVPKPT